jgi:hypothetical protein
MRPGDAVPGEKVASGEWASAARRSPPMRSPRSRCGGSPPADTGAGLSYSEAGHARQAAMSANESVEFVRGR